MAASSSILHNLLECPVCTNTMFPPIRQCYNGHALCSNCKAKVHCCPICRDVLGNIRCLALEKAAESVEWPCKYQNVGCKNMSPYLDVLNHENNNCKFRPYNCPAAGVACPVTGDIQFLVTHLQNDHQVEVFNTHVFNNLYIKSIPQEIVNGSWKMGVFNCFSHQFCLYFEAFLLGRSPVYMAFMRFMGEPDDAKRFGYSLQVGGNGRHLMWTGIPRSIRESSRTIRDSLDGLIIHRSTVLCFSGGETKKFNLPIVGCIWRANP